MSEKLPLRLMDLSRQLSEEGFGGDLTCLEDAADAIGCVARLTRELDEARSQRGALLPWVHVWDDRNHCRQCDGHGRHLPDCKLKAALGAAKGGA